MPVIDLISGNSIQMKYSIAASKYEWIDPMTGGHKNPLYPLDFILQILHECIL